MKILPGYENSRCARHIKRPVNTARVRVCAIIINAPEGDRRSRRRRVVIVGDDDDTASPAIVKRIKYDDVTDATKNVGSIGGG